MCHTQKRKGHLHCLIQAGKLVQVPLYHWADGEQEWIITCKEHVTGDDDRLACVVLLSPRAGRAERVTPCCLCTVEGVRRVGRQMNQLMEITACCSHPVTALRDWKLHCAQLRGASVSS